MRFRVEIDDIKTNGSFNPINLYPKDMFCLFRTGWVKPVQARKFSDSEIVNSPSAIGFDVDAFVNQAGDLVALHRAGIR